MTKREFLKRHPLIDYIQQCLRHCGDRSFVDVVNAINRDPNLLYFQHCGEKWPGENFYDIFLDCPSKGFFALFNQTLDALKYAERFHLTPVVTWSDACLYKEDRPVNGSGNPFEYYFEPVCGFSRDDLAQARRVLKYSNAQRALDRNHPFGVVSKTIVDNGCYAEYIAESSEIYAKYIRLKVPVCRFIEESMTCIGFAGSVLGVHVRATDFNNGYIDHAKAVTENQYLETVRRALSENDFDRVFLATDDAAVVQDFRREFGDRVICCDDVFRSTNGEAVHFSTGDREDHKYMLGLEVIRDMVLLSRCEGLIGSYSNVCIAAQIARKGNGADYRYLNVIDNGFNQTGKTTYQDRFAR